MGTRRSKHNKGRKPLYKDHGRDNVSDRWDAEHAQHTESARAEALESARREPRGDWKIAKPSPTLLPIVEQYLAARKKTEAERKRPSGSEKRLIEVQPRAQLADPVRRDLLLQLFAERAISVGQLHAGRIWQHNHELATIQPSTTIDWTRSEYPYQQDGTVTDEQWRAIRYRRQFQRAEGQRAVVLLDYCLAPDRRRADIMSALKIDGECLLHILVVLLDKVCMCFGERRSAA